MDVAEPPISDPGTERIAARPSACEKLIKTQIRVAYVESRSSP